MKVDGVAVGGVEVGGVEVGGVAVELAAVVDVAREVELGGVAVGQGPRCLIAIHAGAPLAMASSGQVDW